MDLMEGFEIALDGGPAHRPVEERLVAGRKVVRRRRRAIGFGVVGAVLVLGGAGWTVLPDSDDGPDAPVATSATPSPTPATASNTPTRALPLRPFAYDVNSSELETAPGLVIERQIESPVARKGVVSAAAVATYKGERWWLMAANLQGRSGWGEESPVVPNRTFEQWVHELTVLNTDYMFDGRYDRGWVTLGEDGVLTPHQGASILEQSSPARIDQAPAGVPSATAMIEVDGARICVVARIIASDDPPILYLPESQYPGCGEAVHGFDYPGHPDS